MITIRHCILAISLLATVLASSRKAHAQASTPAQPNPSVKRGAADHAG